tara:strand:- start:11650 stop:12528 length:879 start_codon:yes stop_codon:yes gene_type:complete
MMMKKISATALAKANELQKVEVDNLLKDKGYISQDDEGWQLTSAGKQAGGEVKESDKFGKYIIWPEDILQEEAIGKVITARIIAQHFGISSLKINPILSELGWIDKGLKGWVITEQGKKQNGIQKEDKRSGVPYVAWTESILTNKSLLNSINELQGGAEEETASNTETNKTTTDEFRQKFKAVHRCTDGHYVRSKAEMLIDNWLYMAEVIHAYERKLPIEEDVYCDFYLPTGKVYIEYWGYEEAEKYLKRKHEKQAIYSKYNFNLIELTEKEVQNLDDILPRELLKHGIKTY